MKTITYFFLQDMLEDNAWAIEPPEIIELKNKILSKGTQIKEIPEIKIYRGILTGYNKAFIIDKDTKNQLIEEDPKNSEIIKPILRGRDIKKWKLNYQNLYLIFTRRGININEYPSIKKYLSQFKERLKPKNNGEKIGRKAGQYKWYEIQDTVLYYQEMDKKKIVYPDISQDLFAIYDNKKYYTNDRCFILTTMGNSYNLKSICCLLSSNLFKFIFILNGALLGKKGFKLAKIYIEQLPIIKLSTEEINNISRLYDELITLSDNNQIKSVKKIEKELNDFIYDLYELNSSERIIIENYINLFNSI